MSRILVEEPVAAQFRDRTDVVEICDATGRVLGWFRPADVEKSSVRSPNTTEELRRRSAEPGGMTLDQFWKTLSKS